MKLTKKQTMLSVLKFVQDSELGVAQQTEGYDKNAKLVDYVPPIQHINECGGYLRLYIPIMVVHSTKRTDHGLYVNGLQGHVHLQYNKTRDNGDRACTFGVDIETKTTIPDEIAFYRWVGQNMEKVVDVLEGARKHFDSIVVYGAKSDWAWIAIDTEKKTKAVKVSTPQEFGDLCNDLVNDYYGGDEQIGQIKGLIKFLKKKGGSKKQTETFKTQIHSLQNDKSELSGSPDRWVVERFDENLLALNTVLVDVLGKETFDECNIFF
jgi:hypothetical protein